MKEKQFAKILLLASNKYVLAQSLLYFYNYCYYFVNNIKDIPVNEFKRKNGSITDSSLIILNRTTTEEQPVSAMGSKLTKNEILSLK